MDFEIFQWLISKIYSHLRAAEIFTYQWLISKSYSHLGASCERVAEVIYRVFF